jgi:hypothetical protein
MITIRAVLSEMNKPVSVFDITYRKTDGSWGEKKGCMLRRNTTNELGERKRMNRSGTIKLAHKSSGAMMDIYIDLLLTFNGQAINHLT